MTPEQYLQGLLNSQVLTPEQMLTLNAHKEEVTKYLLEKFYEQKPSIKYAGSYAKETMIRNAYDLDVVCYFPSDDTRTLKEIRDDISEHLNEKYVMEAKVSAERILNLKGVTAPRGYHIDVVPGRFIADSSDVFLHLDGAEKERLQTNLKTHIDHIKNSGCVPVIRLVKIWAHRNNIKMKTFVLELFVVEVLKGSHSKGNLTDSFLKVLEEMKNHFSSIELIDPANTNNVVSRLITKEKKGAIVKVANETLGKLSAHSNLNAWKEIFDEGATNIIPASHSTPLHSGIKPTSPWLV